MIDRAWVRRFAWPLGSSALILAGALAPASPVWDAARLAAVPGAHLARPAPYVLLAPLSDLLDAISLLSAPQLIALALSLLVVYIGWRLLRRRRQGTSAGREFRVGLRSVLMLILLMLLAAVLPRPMAALTMDDPDALIFDIHSHTNYSHDARATFTVEANRAWHRAAGFQLAYITDHRCFDGAAEGERANPARAGDGTVLLSGIELPADQLHVIALEAPDVAVPPGLLERWCVRAKAGRVPPASPLLLQTIPENLLHMRIASAPGDSGVSAIELSDGAPRGIAQSQRDHTRILTVTAIQRLAYVAGSNNHGWGRTAVAWNVMRLPGWRALRPDSVGALIERQIRAEKNHAVQVIARRSPSGMPRPWLALTLPAMTVNVLRTMSLAERLSWIAWLWLAVGFVALRRAAGK